MDPINYHKSLKSTSLGDRLRMGEYHADAMRKILLTLPMESLENFEDVCEFVLNDIPAFVVR